MKGITNYYGRTVRDAIARLERNHVERQIEQRFTWLARKQAKGQLTQREADLEAQIIRDRWQR